MNKKIKLLLPIFVVHLGIAKAQSIANGDFKKWGNEYDQCPTGWGCNNDTDCKGKVSIAHKLKGGAKLSVVHCWDPKKDDRSNNVNMNYDDLTAKITKGKKVKISFDYSYSPVAGDRAYVKIDIDVQEEMDRLPMFFYNDKDNGILKPGPNQRMVCYLNFDPANALNYIAPQNMTASSIRTTFGIMDPEGADDTHKGSTLIINHVKFEFE